MNNEQVMERRLSSRKRVSASVYLAWPGRRPQRYRVSDVSRSGVFVQMRPRGVARGAQLEMVLVVPRGSLHKIYRLPATVVRVGEGGAALEVRRRRRA